MIKLGGGGECPASGYTGHDAPGKRVAMGGGDWGDGPPKKTLIVVADIIIFSIDH